MLSLSSSGLFLLVFGRSIFTKFAEKPFDLLFYKLVRVSIAKKTRFTNLKFRVDHLISAATLIGTT